MSKHILLITQWFDPEPTFKGLLFAKELVKKGFSVQVLTGFPNYPGGKIYPDYKIKLIQKEYIDGVSVIRLPLYPSHNNSKLGRIFNYMSFALSTIFYGILFAKKPNVIYAYHPPLTTGIAAVVIKFFRRAPVVYDIQDLWPDTLKATGMIKSKKVLKFISRVCNKVYSLVDQIVVLSPGFKSMLIKRKVPEDKIDVIYNWADESVLRSVNEQNQEFNKNNFNILFAGNIGRAQKLEIILNAAKILTSKPNKIRFTILGGGLALDSLKFLANELNLTNVKFLPEVPMNKVGSYLYAADALFIHLNKNKLFEITIPGKTQAYMSVGKPIIIGVKGDAANLITNGECGVSIEPEDAKGLADAALYLSSMDKNVLKKMGNNARVYYDKNLSVACGIDRFVDIFTKIMS